MEPKSEWDELKAQEAAYLKARYRMNQVQIKEILRVSQSKVSRLLKLAEDKLWLQTQFVSEGISAKRQEEIVRILEPLNLAKTLQSLKTETGVRVRNVRSFDSGSSSPRDIPARLRSFGLLAAARVGELLQENVEMFAVTFGETVTRVVDGLAELHLPLRHKQPIQFIPVCAELVRHAAYEFSSSRLAYRMREIVNGGAGDSLSLAGLPAYLPRTFFEPDLEDLRDRTHIERLVDELRASNSSYRRIFNEPNPMVNRLDGLLTSIGPSERTLGLSHSELLEAAQMSDEKLRSVVVGDIGGVLIPRADGRRQDEVFVLNEMWSGIRLEHVVDLTRRAANAGKPGVVIVAIGSDKAFILKELLVRGWVNELIIDKDLEVALAKAM